MGVAPGQFYDLAAGPGEHRELAAQPPELVAEWETDWR